MARAMFLVADAGNLEFMRRKIAAGYAYSVDYVEEKGNFCDNGWTWIEIRQPKLADRREMNRKHSRSLWIGGNCSWAPSREFLLRIFGEHERKLERGGGETKWSRKP